MNSEIEKIASAINENKNGIRVVTYINSLQELDLADLKYFVEHIIENNAKTIILQEHDIPLYLIHNPQGFHDEDMFEEGGPKFPVLLAYTSPHTESKESLAEAYIKQYNIDLDPVMDESVLKIAKTINEDISSDIVGKVEIIKYIQPFVFEERNNFHLEDLASWCEAAKQPNVGLAMIGLTDREVECMPDEPQPEPSTGLHDDDEFDDEYYNQYYVMYTPENAPEELVRQALKIANCS